MLCSFFVMQHLVFSGFPITWVRKRERELGALLILSGCYCSLNISHGAMDWFAVVIVPFPGHTHLLLVLNIYIKQEDY